MRAPILLLAVLLGACSPAPDARPDVLVIIADDLTSKAVGAFGGEWIATPNIDRLAAEGMTFEKAVCASPFCTPSRQSFLTGRWPHSIGVTQIQSVLPRQSTTLATVFGSAGYRTAAIGKMHWPPEAGDADYGFQLVLDQAHWLQQLDEDERSVYEVHRSLWRRESRRGWSVANPERVPCSLEEDRQLAPWLVDRALEFLEESDEPALCFVSFYETHEPFSFPPRLRDVVDPATLRLPAFDPEDVRENAPGLTLALRRRLSENGDLDEATIRGAVASYLASTAWLDEQVGNLIDRLEAAGRRDSTVIVFWSDNGYFLGERGMIGKNYPFREAAEVPLAIAGPGIPRGRSDALVQTLDLFPTLCELASVAPPAELHGRSLTPLWSGEPAVRERAAAERDQAFSEFIGLTAALQTREHKLMLGTAADQGWDLLFEFGSDPSESRNRFDDPALGDVRDDLVARMYELLRSTPADGIAPAQWMTQPDRVEAIRWALRQIDRKSP